MKPKQIDQAIDAAARNGGILTRSPDGTWHGATSETQSFSTDIIAALVKAGRATYTRFREGSKAGIEVSIIASALPPEGT
jgi:hypothetical protein